jgi:Fe-S-cluster containining protein
LSDPLPAGGFSAWLRDMRAALSGSTGMDVACGDCRGCCTSSYFIKVRAHETAALARIGPDNLRPVPGATNGSMLMGFDERGHCFMFENGGCSIYQDRPETCRTYDCRVFTAAGMNAGPDKTEINERISRWRFDYPTQRDRDEHRAVTAVANYLRQHPVRFPGGRVPSRPSEIAVLAVKSFEVFMGAQLPEREIGSAIVDACRRFDSASREAMETEARATVGRP